MPMASREAQREYQREWMARRRADWFAGKSCVKCGSTGDLELDHVDPDLKVTHRIWSWSKERSEEELAKCQVLCSDCHLKKTKVDVSKALTKEYPHGTIGRYKQGCKCEPCTEDLRRYWRERRASVGR